VPELSTALSSLKNSAIAARITELEARGVPPLDSDASATAWVERKAAVTREWVIDQLVDNVDRAKAEKNFNAVNKALHLLGLERGMFGTVVKPGIVTDPDQLTDAELIAIIRGGDDKTNGGDHA
jgi:hypothetical protein